MDIYVGNLSYKTTDADLKSLFEAYGEVESARVVTEHGSGRSKGFGFVLMPNSDDAQKACEALNGHEFMERALRVNESQPKPRDDRRGGGGGGGFRDRRGGGGGGFRGDRGGGGGFRDRGDRGERPPRW